MNKRRLLKLADLLEADAKNKKGIKFNLNVIAVKADIYERDGYVQSAKFTEGEVPLNCGTMACAVGLACISGAFKRSGLSYKVDSSWGFEPSYDGVTGWGAEMHFFNLTQEESDFLFQTEAYPRGKSEGAVGERYVAKRIRDFVAGKVAP